MEDCGTSPSDDTADDSQATDDIFETTTKKVLSPSGWFNNTMSDPAIEKSLKGLWAVRVFTQWVEQRNKRMVSLICWRRCTTLVLFAGVCSKSKESGWNKLPPKTIYQILCGLF